MTSFAYWQARAAERGGFVCMICLNGFPFEFAWEDVDGQLWDVCGACGPLEEVDRRSGRHN